MLKHGVQYATVVTKRCPMSDPACAARVIERLTELYPPGLDVAAMVEQACGRFVRGQHKGQLRGWAELDIVTEGGWKRRGPSEGNGYVVYPGRCLAVRIVPFAGPPYLEVGA